MSQPAILGPNKERAVLCIYDGDYTSVDLLFKVQLDDPAIVGIINDQTTMCIFNGDHPSQALPSEVPMDDPATVGVPNEQTSICSYVGDYPALDLLSKIFMDDCPTVSPARKQKDIRSYGGDYPPLDLLSKIHMDEVWNFVMCDRRDSILNYRIEKPNWPKDLAIYFWNGDMKDVPEMRPSATEEVAVEDVTSGQQQDLTELTHPLETFSVPWTPMSELVDLHKLVESPQCFHYPHPYTELELQGQSSSPHQDKPTVEDYSSIQDVNGNLDTSEPKNENISLPKTENYVPETKSIPETTSASNTASVSKTPSLPETTNYVPMTTGRRFCTFCKSNGQCDEFCATHAIKDPRGVVMCSILRAIVCTLCGATGDDAHTLSYCRLALKPYRARYSIHKKRGNGFVGLNHCHTVGLWGTLCCITDLLLQVKE